MAIRWVGGKNVLSKKIDQFFPSIIRGNYIEPFLGGGSIAEVAYKHCFGRMILSDACFDVAQFHFVVKDISGYYSIKKLCETPEEDGGFLIKNRCEWENINLMNPKDLSDEEASARFLALIYRSFGGRLHWRHGFVKSSAYQEDIPNNRYIGKIPWHSICGLTNLKKSEVIHCDYSWTMIAEDDYCKDAVVYLDPPYLDENEGKTERPYDKKWSEKDLKKLVAQAELMHAKGAKIILSEHDSWTVRSVLDTKIWKIHKVSVHRSFSRNSKYSDEIIATTGEWLP